jgi:Flp pilus assembly protein TadD
MAADRLEVGIVLWLLAVGGLTALDKEGRLFEFHGQILGSDGKLIRDPEPLVFLHGGTLPYNSHALVGLDGTFKFQKLLPGSYVLIVAVPGQGEMRRTVEIGPTLADKKGRVREVFEFTSARSPDDLALIHKSQISVPKKAQEDLDRARKCLGNNDVEGARKRLESALTLAPHFAEAWNQLGVIAYQTADYRTAEQHFRRALAEDPRAYWALVNLGGALLAVGKIEESLEVNQKAVNQAPEDALAHSQLGKSHMGMRQFEKAEMHLRQAKALDPRHFSAPQLALADVYYLQGRFEERIRELEEYLKYHPDGYIAPRVRTLLEEARRPR